MAKRTRINVPEGKPNSKMPEHILESILAGSHARLAELGGRATDLERMAADRPDPPPFAAALRHPTISVIAEVKRRSPSLGVIGAIADPVALARAYEAGGAAAISVLTEEQRFGGSIADLEAISDAVRIPALRKDFIVGELQLVEARAAGAGAVLLIVRALQPAMLAHLIAAADALRLGVLVETHTAEEIGVALDSGAMVIGVNARDLDTLEINCHRAWQLLAGVPKGVVAVAESGMHSRPDVEAAARAGADAVLMGSALVASTTPADALRSLQGIERLGR